MKTITKVGKKNTSGEGTKLLPPITLGEVVAIFIEEREKIKSPPSPKKIKDLREMRMF